MTNRRATDLDSTWRRLFALAYRMTGRVADAQDIVQNAFLRFEARRGAIDVHSPSAYLARIVTRLALNAARDRKRSPIDYVGFDLPEPAPDFFTAEARDDLAYGLTVALQMLGPVERAVYLLRTMYDTDYADIGAIVGRHEAACRKIFSRSQQRMRKTHPLDRPPSKIDRRLLERLVDAVRANDLAAVAAVLAEDATLLTNGPAGGPALRQALVGRDAVARFAMASSRLLPEGATTTIEMANGAAILLATRQDAPAFALIVEGATDRIERLYAIADPRRLASLSVRRERPKPGAPIDSRGVARPPPA